MPPTAREPPINLPRLREWIPDPQAFDRLLDVYVAESIRALSEVYAGVAEGDFSRVQDATHSWKTSNAWLGSDTLVELCLELEKLGKENRIREQGMEIVHRMLKTFEGISAYLAGPARKMSFPDPLVS